MASKGKSGRGTKQNAKSKQRGGTRRAEPAPAEKSSSRTVPLLIVSLIVIAAVVLLIIQPWAGTGTETPDGGGNAGTTPSAPTDVRAEFVRIAEDLEANGLSAFFGARFMPQMRQEFENPQLPLQQRVNRGTNLTRVLLAEGRTEDALVQMNEVIDLIESLGREAAPDLYLQRAIVHLRRAEVQNCIARHNPDCCIFPLEGGAVHTVKEPAEAARRDYLRVLSYQPQDLRARWLLNLASMAVGDHPEGVPGPFVIPPEVFESSYDVGRFPDIAPVLGLDAFNRCGGVIIEDFDGDGLLDIVTSTLDPLGPLTYYHNLGAEGFEDRSESSGLANQLGGLNCIGGDYDNDGDMDILVLRGAWWFDSGRIRNSLLRNEGNGTFTDVTHAAGLAGPEHDRPTQAGVWADFDNDGDLDLYIGNESRLDQNQPEGNYPSQLYRNNGDGTFTDVARQAGVTNDRYSKGVTIGDYDDDGDVDLYVSNGKANRLYRNDGNLRFTDVAPQLNVDEPTDLSFATWFFDYNNDGKLDLFVAAYRATVADIAADYLGGQHQASVPRLYHNAGNDSFINVAERMDLDHPTLPMGANFGDLDLDGWLDIYLTTGEPDYQSLMPNVMLRNDRGRIYQDVSKSGGFGHLQKGHGIAFGDLDNDGDQDIYHQLGGFYKGDAFHNALFLNPGHGNRFLTVRLVGTTTNRMAVGARITVEFDTPEGPRSVHRAVGSVSSFGGSPARQEIGLGMATAITAVEVEWPTSGTRQRFTDVPLDAFIRITEGQDAIERLEPPVFNLGDVARAAASAG